MKSLEFLETRERFLPFRPATLLEHMLKDCRCSAEERQQFRLLFEMIGARFHFEFRKQLEELKTLYDPFDPDRDTLPLEEPTAQQLAAQREQLQQDYRQLLLEGNYVELSRQQMRQCLELQTHGGLSVTANLDDYEELLVFARGVHRQTRPVRSWLTPWKAGEEQVDVLARTALLVRRSRQKDDRIYLKLFKNVVAADLEMILPHVRIRMRLFDQLKIGSSMAGSLGTAAWKAFTAAILSPWIFLLVFSGFVGACIKGVFSFLASKNRYIQALTANLYFQSLANNAGVLTYLVDAAEAEEAKEMLLAYFMLYVERDRDYTQEELDRRVEAWLREQFGLDIDFEVADAVRKLVEKGLVLQRDICVDGQPRRVLKVYDLPSALRRLDEVWDNYYQINGVVKAEDHVAEGPHWKRGQGTGYREQTSQMG